MKIKDIIDYINKIITSERKLKNINNGGFLVVQEKIIPHKIIKIIKETSIILWYVNPSNKIKKEVISIINNSRMPSGQEDKYLDIVEKELVYKLFEFIRTKDFEKIINGTYGE